MSPMEAGARERARQGTIYVFRFQEALTEIVKGCEGFIHINVCDYKITFINYGFIIILRKETTTWDKPFNECIFHVLKVNILGW